MRKIAFKIAFSPKIGTGHIYRCARLSLALKKKGIITFFLSNKEINRKFFFLKKSFSHCIVNKSFIREKNFLQSKNIKNLLIDDPKLTLEKQKKYKNFLNKLIIYQDLPSKNFADILINHNHLKEIKKKYKKLSNTKCKFYLGPKYYLFDRYNNLNKKKNSITVFLGGNTPKGLLDKVLKIISECNLRKFKVIIFTGIFNKKIFLLKKKYSTLSIELKTQKTQKLFFDTISHSRIFFSTCGSTILESIFLKTPSVAFLRASNQENNCFNLSKDKIICYSTKKSEIKSFIYKTLNNDEYLKNLIKKLNNFKKKFFNNELVTKILNEIK
jgi:spore coat polysaccharide biosynthesis predicted glycosyltransferase SpsG